MECIICGNKKLERLGFNPSFPETQIYDCHDCNFAMTYPLPALPQLADFYSDFNNSVYHDKSATEDFEKKLEDNYHELLFSLEILGYLDKRALSQFKFLQPFLSYHQSMKALEIGCSAGSLLVLLEQSGFEVIGYEPDEKMALLGNKRLEKSGNIVINQMPDEKDFEMNLYDLICSSHVLEHLRNPKYHLESLRKALKKNGILFMEVPNEYSLGVKKCIDPSINKIIEEQGHLYFYSQVALEKLLNKCGFKILSLKTCGENVNQYFSNRVPRIQSYPIFLPSTILRIKKKLSRILKKANERLVIENSVDNIFEHYWDNPQQGVGIRVIASPS